MNAGSLRVAGIAGSLRKASYNRALLRAAAELAPRGMRIEVFSIDLPLYNQDEDGDDPPGPVAALKSAVDRADGLLIATPEYNFGVPGVLKNAIDWVSRPAFESPLVGKPVGILGASPASTGTARAQGQLAEVIASTLAMIMPHPGFLVGRASGAFSDLQLTDEATRNRLTDYLVSFEQFIRRQSG